MPIEIGIKTFEIPWVILFTHMDSPKTLNAMTQIPLPKGLSWRMIQKYHSQNFSYGEAAKGHDDIVLVVHADGRSAYELAAWKT